MAAAIQANTKYTVKELLEALGLTRKAKRAVGHGLNIGGLNVTSLEQAIRIPEGTESLTVVIPGKKPIEIEL